MIRQVYSLVLDETDEILGVRIETNTNQKFDLDLETFHKIVKLDVSTLEPLELFEHGDKLLTQEEFYQGVLVEDASQNPKLLNHLKTFFMSSKPEDITDPKLLQKREKRIWELRQAFYTYLPDSMLKDFAEYHLNHFEGNKGVYDNLSESRVKEIHTYSRWRSRMLFEEKNKYQLLRTNPKKAEKLLNLMANVEDWQYDGMVDLGGEGGYCTLGHKLRYQHFAYSPSTQRQIEFGSKCVTDFFDIPPQILKELMNAQETILKETKVVVYLLRTGQAENYYKEVNVNLQTVQELIDSKIFRHDKLKTDWLIRMAGFIRVGLPLTRSMVNQLKRFAPSLQEYKQAQAKKDHISKVLDDLKNTSFPQQDLKELLTNPPQNIFEALTAKLLLNGQYDHEVVDLFFKYYYDTVRDIQYHLEQVSKRPLKRFMEDVSMTYQFTKDEKRGVLRLKTPQDPYSNSTTVRGSIFRKESHDLFTALANLVLYKPRNIVVFSVNTRMSEQEKDYLQTIVDSMQIINNLKYHAFTSEFMQEIKYLQDGQPDVQTIEEALQYTTFPLKEKAPTPPPRPMHSDNDSLYAPIMETSKLEKDDTDPSLYNIVSELEKFRKSDIIYIKRFTYDILDTVHKTGRVSEKQEKFIRQGFDQLVRGIEDFAKMGEILSKDDKVLDILKTHKKSGKLSDKQLVYVANATGKLLKAEAEEDEDEVERKDADIADFNEDDLPF